MLIRLSAQLPERLPATQSSSRLETFLFLLSIPLFPESLQFKRIQILWIEQELHLTEPITNTEKPFPLPGKPLTKWIQTVSCHHSSFPRTVSLSAIRIWHRDVCRALILETLIFHSIQMCFILIQMFITRAGWIN